METAIHRITFKNSRIFNIFCANSKQNKDMVILLFKMKKVIRSHEVLVSGIHTIKQFKKWEPIITAGK